MYQIVCRVKSGRRLKRQKSYLTGFEGSGDDLDGLFTLSPEELQLKIKPTIDEQSEREINIATKPLASVNHDTDSEINAFAEINRLFENYELNEMLPEEDIVIGSKDDKIMRYVTAHFFFESY